MNVFTEPDLKKAADSLNASAPEGERLAYVNPEEESMLLGAGGAGVPTNESGVPSYFAWLPFLGRTLLSAGIGAGVGKLLGGGGGGGDRPTYAQQMDYLMKTDPERARMMYNRQTGGGEYAGISDFDLTKARMAQERELAPEMYQQRLAEMEEYGPQFISQKRELDRLSEPELWARQQEYFADPYGGGPSPTEIYGEGPELSEIADYEGMELGDMGMTPELREYREQQLGDALAMPGMTQMQRNKFRQTALGQLGGKGASLLGGAPGMRLAEEEFVSDLQLQERRGADFDRWMQSGQSVGDTARRDAAMRADDAYRKFQTNMQQGQMQFGQQGARLGGQMAATQAEANRGAGFAGMQQVGGQMPFMTPQMQQVGTPGFMGQAASAYGTAMGGYNAAQARPGIGSLLGTLGGAYLGTDTGAGMLGKFGSWLTGGAKKVPVMEQGRS